MGIPGDRGEEPERQGGWQSEWQPGGWQSQWQQPGGQAGWQRQEQPATPQPGGLSGWTQTADGRWIQTSAPASSGKATAALVLGILGFVFCPLVCSVLALVFGYQSRREIDASGGRIGGRGNATAGIVLGWIGVVIWGLFIALIVIGIAAGGTDGGGPGSGVPA